MLRIGIIGFGRIGAEHQMWLARSQLARAVAAADLTEGRRQLAESRGLKAYENVESLLEDRAVDAVLVSTPTAFHHDHAASALSAGKHVMIEKPMALDLAEARDLIARAQSARRVLSVFHN